MGLCGCGDPQAFVPKIETPTKSTADEDPLPVEDLSPEAIETALSQLPAAQREEAERQKRCPVTELPLGAMGAPTTIEHDGHKMFLCCKHCERLFKKYPKKYTAKVAEWLNPSEKPEPDNDPVNPRE